MTKKQFRLTKAEAARLKRLEAEHGGDTATKKMASKMYREHMEVHRGAIPLYDELPDADWESLVFGNDSFKSDVRARKEVAQLALRLDQLDVLILGFGLGPNGVTWAIRVDAEHDDLLDLLVWDVWFSICCPKANPVTKELNECLNDLGYEVAA